MIHGHGDDTYRFQSKIQVNFSTNIPSVRHHGLEAHLSRSIGLIAGYPDPDAAKLAGRIAAASAVGEGNIIVTNGAVDAIYAIAQMREATRSAILSPTFSEYGDAARICRHEVIHFDAIDNLPIADNVWVCNPNNPTGEFITADKLLNIVDSNTDKLFVIDQAYEDYVTDRCIRDIEAATRPNVILLHSMTKRYHIPGLRIGYVVASTDIINKLKLRRMPWAVNAIAIEAVNYALDHPDEFIIDAASMVSEQLRLSSALNSIGVTTEASCTNFVLCKLPIASSAELKRWLVDNCGILIRDASNFHGLTERYFRVAVQKRSENDLLINYIDRWLHEH